LAEWSPSRRSASARRLGWGDDGHSEVTPDAFGAIRAARARIPFNFKPVAAAADQPSSGPSPNLNEGLLS